MYADRDPSVTWFDKNQKWYSFHNPDYFDTSGVPTATQVRLAASAAIRRKQAATPDQKPDQPPDAEGSKARKQKDDTDGNHPVENPLAVPCASTQNIAHYQRQNHIYKQCCEFFCYIHLYFIPASVVWLRPHGLSSCLLIITFPSVTKIGPPLELRMLIIHVGVLNAKVRT